jgi:hypothetical protein
MLSRPSRLDIVPNADRRLVGTDENGIRWLISWCGNGPYSHWHLRNESDPESGWYVYSHTHGRKDDLVEQIRAEEEKYGIYS